MKSYDYKNLLIGFWELEDVVNKGEAFVMEQYNERDEKDFITKES